MLPNRRAKSTGIKNKGVILTDKDFGPVNGWDILLGWLGSRTLPEPFSCIETVETTPPLPKTVLEAREAKSDIPRVQENRVQEKAVGEVLG